MSDAGLRKVTGVFLVLTPREYTVGKLAHLGESLEVGGRDR